MAKDLMRSVQSKARAAKLKDPANYYPTSQGTFRGAPPTQAGPANFIDKAGYAAIKKASGLIHGILNPDMSGKKSTAADRLEQERESKEVTRGGLGVRKGKK